MALIEKDLLTEREKELLPLFAEGMTDQEIGDKCFITPETARKHFKNICEKVGIDGLLKRTKLCNYYFTRFKP